jgi:hypothetical protein
MSIPIIPSELRTTLEQNIKAIHNWIPEDYKLQYLDLWPNDRLPIIVAIPTKYKVDYSPTYAILPDGQIISQYDKEGIKKILIQLYPSITSKDARFIAELFLKFALFSYPVGRLWEYSLDNKIDSKKQPRKESFPVMKTEKGAFILEFYTFNSDLNLLSDCRVKIQGSGYEMEAKVLNR